MSDQPRDSSPATPPVFPPGQYRPADHEGVVRDRWERARAFEARPDRVLSAQARPYCVLIPPPNVTAALHLGHALNNILQDVLVRAHRMMGFETLWMPGTDHAGIATQTVVDKRLQGEGKPAIAQLRLTPGGREQFVAAAQAFKDEYEARITHQLKAMGCSCDWRRQRFTMDDICARAVREAFFRLFRDGLIYRGKRLVNWDPVTQTALADDEVEMEEVDGKFYYLRYPLVHPPVNRADPRDAREVTWSELARRGYPGADAMPEDDNAFLTVATTRPETYLGDTAVAVNPRDPRAVSLRGLSVQLPLVGRIIPIVEDDYVVMPDHEGSDPKAKFATGFLKVTPAHDPNDYELGRRHDLACINVMAPDASISDRHGWTDVGDAHIFVGKSREEARELVVREFKVRGLFDRSIPYRHSVGHSYRSHAAIEPYLSDQWYVRVTDDRLRGSALRAMASDQRATPGHADRKRSGDAELRFYPDRYARTFEQWHENLRDWCISRQLWWGHRIPVWTGPASRLGTLLAVLDGDLSHARVNEESGEAQVCLRAENPAARSALERNAFRQDPDVLDTWFSSALWPLSTMGWPDPERAARESGIPDFPALLPAFNPSSVLCTAREIITLWVSRMVMFNRYFTREPRQVSDGDDGRLPFRDVYIHTVIQDGAGQKMSKSLGNGVDPLDIVESHGADALRFTLVKMTTQTQDVRMPVDLVCPHCARTFEPRSITTPAGHVVAAPEQACPACARPMLTVYGSSIGRKATGEIPLARNTSSKFDEARNFCNKLWNATRFALTILGGTPADTRDAFAREPLPLPDRWILARLHATIAGCARALEAYQFSVYATTLYDFLWRDFCDWYLEAIKPTVAQSAAQRAVLASTLDATLRLLHPVTPFITEAAWERLAEVHAGRVEGVELTPARAPGVLASAGWPVIAPGADDGGALREFARVQELVTAIREVRAQHAVQPRRKIRLCAPPGVLTLVERTGVVVATLAGLASASAEAPAGASVPARFEGLDLRLWDLADAIEAGAERERLTKQGVELGRQIVAREQRLANPGYADRAPPKLVQQTREELAKLREELAVVERAIEGLGK